MSRIRHPKGFWSGVIFMALGAFALVWGARYTIGTAARMGPGYFPRILGILMLFFGFLLALRAFRLDVSFCAGNTIHTALSVGPSESSRRGDARRSTISRTRWPCLHITISSRAAPA